MKLKSNVSGRVNKPEKTLDLRKPAGVDATAFKNDDRLSDLDRIRIAKMGMAAGQQSIQNSLKNTTSLNKESSEVEELAVRVTNNTLGPEWIRQDFPSRHRSYGDGDIFVRPMNITNLSHLSAAANKQNFTMYIDALAPCISMDIRDLTPPDFTFFLYWLRRNTFPRTPMRITWTSKYGNQCEYRVEQSDLEIIELGLSEKEYASWVERGICLPTVRDMELLNTENIPEEDRWRIELAQYIYTEDKNPKTYLRSKLNKLEEMGPEGYLLIQEFAKLITHGVVESVKVRDNKFEPTEAISYLTRTADDLENAASQLIANGFEQGQEVQLLALTQHISSLREDATKIQTALDNEEPYMPDEEVIALSINAMTFFPQIH